MNALRSRAFALANLLFCAAVLWVTWRLYADLGFPDGHLTQLDRARKAVYPIFIVLFMLLMLPGLAYLIGLKKGLAQLFILLVILTALLLSLDVSLAQWLEHGSGA